MTSVLEDKVIVTCKNNYTLTDNMTLHFPGIELEGSALTEEDEADVLEFASKENFDYVCLTNTRKATDVEHLQNYMNEANIKNIGIIAKIDTNEGLNNFEEILDVADGIMICRADLSLEIPAEKVYVA